MQQSGQLDEETRNCLMESNCLKKLLLFLLLLAIWELYEWLSGYWQ